MESVRMLFNDADFDRIVHDGLPEGCDLTIATKEHATANGKAAVVISWTVSLPDGSIRSVQAVTTLGMMLTILGGIRGYAKRVGQWEGE